MNAPVTWLWLQVAALYAAIVVLLEVANAPSPPLFAGLGAGGFAALRSVRPVALPGLVRTVGFGIVGIAAGATIDTGVLRTIASRPVIVFGGVLATLIVSLAAGQVLRFQPHVSRSTALFASIAGGASGVSVVAEEFGADAPTVMAVQYLRVVVVLVSVPLVAHLLGTTATGREHDEIGGSALSGLGFVLIALVLSAVLARFIRFSASGILLPLVVATALTLSGVFASVEVPRWVVAIGYTVVGLNVGFGFTRGQLRRLARLFPLALLQTVLGVVGCTLAGLALASLAGISRLDGYLATSPGGLPAVVAVALDSGGDVGLILTMQVVRVFLALLCAPILGAWLRRRTQRQASTSGFHDSNS